MDNIINDNMPERNKNPTEENYNLIERGIALISPEWAYRRAMWRMALPGYKAGAYSRGNANWTPADQKGEIVNRQYRRAIKARARDQERNNDVMGGILNALNRNVVGLGFNLQADTGNDDLDQQLEDIWFEWSKKHNCDITGQQSLREIIKMILTRSVIDGGILIIKTYTGNKKFPLQLQVREVDDLDSLGTVQNPNDGNNIIEGVEVDKYGKPVAFHINDTDPNGLMTNTKPKRIPADQVIYMWKRNRPSEYREISNVSRVIPRTQDLEEYMASVTFMQKILSGISVFVKQAIPNAGVRLGREDEKSADGNRQQRIKAGQIMYLNPGEDVSTLIPSGQAAEATNYAILQQRMAASSIGLSLEGTTRNVSEVNYSSARQNMLEDMKTYRDWQLWLIDHFLDEVYEAVVISAYLAGTINIPDFWKNKSKYLNHKFIGQGMEWIDPLKDAKANEIMLNTKQTTLATIYAEQGMDWREELKQMATEKEYIESLGLIDKETKEGGENEE